MNAMQPMLLSRTAVQAPRALRACPPRLAALRPLGVALLTWGWLGMATGTPLLASASPATAAAPAPAGATATTSATPALPWGSGFERRQAMPNGAAGTHTERLPTLPTAPDPLPLAARTPTEASGHGTGQGGGRGSGRSR